MQTMPTNFVILPTAALEKQAQRRVGVPFSKLSKRTSREIVRDVAAKEGYTPEQIARAVPLS